MAVFTFVCKSDGDSWTAKQHPGDGGLEASSDSTFKLQRALTSLAVSSGASGSVSSSFSYITPSAAVFQVIIGGGGGVGFAAGGGAAPASGGGAAAAAAPVEEKEEPKKVEEESDDDMGFSLFD